MRYSLTVLLVVAACLVSTAAEATTVRSADLQRLTTTAQAIVHGRVVAVQSQWNESGGIHTLVTVEVSEYLKGNFGAQVVFQVPGGRVGPFRSVRAGAPVFRTGEEIVVFLDGAAPTIPHIVGFNQGVMRVRVDAAGRRSVESPVLSAAAPARVAQPSVRGAGMPVPLAQVQQRVQAILNQPHKNVAGPRPGVAARRTR